MTIRINHVLICFTLCMVIFGCRDSLSLVPESTHVSENGKVPVHLVVGGLSATSKTITPDHITVRDLENPARYKVILDGTSNMGDSVRLDPVSFTHGMVGLDLNPGIWTLRLTVTDITTSKQILTGSGTVSVKSKPISTTVTLNPLQGETGTVDITFTLSDSIMQRLDKDTSDNATITIALYDTVQQEVPGTKHVFSQAATGASVPLLYTANSKTLTAGRYSIKLESSYTVQNSLTQNLPMKYEMGYTDILYVEGNRETRASIELTSNSKELGVPDNPYKRNKMNGSGSSKTNNFTRSTPFNPWGETLWAYGGNWDGEKNGTSNGNEVFIAAWDTIYNADFYEIEVLLHPFSITTNGGGNPNPVPYGKFEQVVYTDSDWDRLKNTPITVTINGTPRTSTPEFFQFSGDPSSPYYYKRYRPEIGYIDKATGNPLRFITCAYKDLARTTFVPNSPVTNGMGNASYRIADTGDSSPGFNGTGTYAYNGQSVGKVGLEGDCSCLGFLVPSFAPRISIAYRLRAVNSYGDSDWVYWKGGIW